ncbi:MAG: methyltransferase [Gammaproteobacteria bacterium]|nr:methyltransferase [Gammaproteobacteria bacterium]MDH4315587.1 methyltransferase [Gammaproteobacteria bacterium]MDH5500678.1 methyltransferase [Gammaproteobacteria bacterium]
MRFITALMLLTIGAAASAQDSVTAEKIKAAMSSDARTADEIARDDNRKPLETLGFFGLKDDMRVIELLPGGGWYTKILAPTLRDKGKLYVAIGTNNVSTNLLNKDGFDKVTALDIGVGLVRDGEFGTNNIAAFEFGVSDVDMVLTFRNMHNFTPQGRNNINAAVFQALKAGGLYGVIDHSRRHMEPGTMENRRRADPVQIIAEALNAGFELVGYSDLHYTPDDELRYEVGRRSVTGNTDRFTLLFRKPAK